MKGKRQGTGDYGGIENIEKIVFKHGPEGNKEFGRQTIKTMGFYFY